MKDLVFLNGSEGFDNFDDFKELSNSFNCILFDNLYKEPDKIIALKFLKPKGIFISTTGLMVEQISRLVDYFEISEFIPDIVVFGSEKSAMSLLGLARDFKEKGTNFFFNFDGELEEIIWI